MRQIVKAYAIVVALALGYAWFIDLTLRDSAREHLLGDMLLAFVSVPTSLSLNVFYGGWPELATRPFAQLIWVSICAVAQVGLLFAATRLIARLRLRDNEYWHRFWS
jgi:hypothetical protein